MSCALISNLLCKLHILLENPLSLMGIGRVSWEAKSTAGNEMNYPFINLYGCSRKLIFFLQFGLAVELLVAAG